METSATEIITKFAKLNKIGIESNSITYQKIIITRILKPNKSILISKRKGTKCSQETINKIKLNYTEERRKISREINLGNMHRNLYNYTLSNNQILWTFFNKADRSNINGFFHRQKQKGTTTNSIVYKGVTITRTLKNASNK